MGPNLKSHHEKAPRCRRRAPHWSSVTNILASVVLAHKSPKSTPHDASLIEEAEKRYVVAQKSQREEDPPILDPHKLSVKIH